MSFRSSFLENLAEEKNKELNIKARKQAAFDQYLIVLMVRSLANVILNKVWDRLLLLRQKLLQGRRKHQKAKRKPSRKSFGRTCFISKRTDQESG